MLTALAASAFSLSSVVAKADVRPAVGKPLQAAIAAVTAGDYRTAVTLVQQAEAVNDLTAEERADIVQMMGFIAVKSGGEFGVSSAIGAQAKFAADYSAGRYRDAINDEALLRRCGALSETNIIVIDQAYYQLGEYKSCARYASSQTIASPVLIERQLLCIWKAQDDNFVRLAIVRALGAAISAAKAGCHERAVELLQSTLVAEQLNHDEQDM